VTGPRIKLEPEIRALTDAQRALYEMVVDAYRADVAVRIATKTRKAFDHDHAQASRQVARGVVIHGLCDYSPEGRYLLLSRRGKALAGIANRMPANHEHLFT